MKNIFNFYLAIFLPLILLVFLIRYQLIDANYFVILLLFYALVYRTFTDGIRLVDKNIIQKKDIWKMIIPGSRLEFFRELYLKK